MDINKVRFMYIFWETLQQGKAATKLTMLYG
jgi:hypothetical protein